jgi:hypothetical protein
MKHMPENTPSSEPAAPEPSPASPDPTTSQGPDAPRRNIILALIAIIAAAVVSDVINAVLGLMSAPPEGFMAGEYVTAWQNMTLWLIQRSLVVITVVMCVLGLVGITPRHIGLGPIRVMDIALGIFLCLLCWTISIIASPMLSFVFGEMPSQPLDSPASLLGWAIFIIGDGANAFAEELAIWGGIYVLLRRLYPHLQTLPIVLAICAFASYHMYYGLTGMLMVAIATGLPHGIAYHLTGRLWPNIISHFLTNLSIHAMAA